MTRTATLPPRWYPLRPVPEQMRLVNSSSRFCVVAAGRRSGKTERAKRKIVRSAMRPPNVDRPLFIACAPTRDQAKRLWWDDLKMLVPREAMVDDPRETDLTIRLVNGSTIAVVGLDKPQRAEGDAIDGAVMDEIQECKREAWERSIRPALSTVGRPPGWAWFIGRPHGRGFFYELFRNAATKEGWEAFHWKSSEVVDAQEIEDAKRDLDPLTYRQEYEAEFVSFEGIAYYTFDPTMHLRTLTYNSSLPLVFCFDFNVDPGVAVVLQEQVFPADMRLGHRAPFSATAVIGEVHIPRNSNTPAVCRRLCADWKHHTGEVRIYGDATGSARKTSQLGGNDWDLIESYLTTAFPNMRNRVERTNPEQRHRVNSVAARLKAASGEVHCLIDPDKAPNLVLDLEGVTLLTGGTGELDKGKDKTLTHMSDAFGYYVHAEYPLGGAIGRSY